MKPEPRNHRLIIRHTMGGDINKTLSVETYDLTATEWEQWLTRESKRVEADRARHAARHQPKGAL